MISKTIQQQLADRLYELLPHKKELEFGCKINFDYDTIDSNGNKEDCFDYIVSNDGYTIRTAENMVFWKSEWEEQKKEIIGQPLRLADLLLAVKYGDMSVDSEGYIRRYDSQKGDWRLLTSTTQRYDITKDNILNQSDEFCEFALNLLN